MAALSRVVARFNICSDVSGEADFYVGTVPFMVEGATTTPSFNPSSAGLSPNPTAQYPAPMGFPAIPNTPRYPAPGCPAPPENSTPSGFPAPGYPAPPENSAPPGYPAPGVAVVYPSPCDPSDPMAPTLVADPNNPSAYPEKDPFLQGASSLPPASNIPPQENPSEFCPAPPPGFLPVGFSALVPPPAAASSAYPAPVYQGPPNPYPNKFPPRAATCYFCEEGRERLNHKAPAPYYLTSL
ncbi:vegetative cell wall protein gp1-like [Hyalella azteca]|uniref:Vegetative cell wall protein gp1-like n=1 Tax=Hyalella azteca TaxID=294128 RepID=A0A979FT13_HYAAZ|nr:vegetative cell wall protein gp1-like [Hyalella azteca]